MAGEEKDLSTIYTCFPGGRHKVLTMSYDDGRIYDRRLVKLFNEYGIKGTFHLNGGRLFGGEESGWVTFDEVRELYRGHEVSCHTYTHPTISRCPMSQVVQQVIEDRKVLEAACGYPVRGMSYPNGSYSREIIRMLPACGIEYSRIVGGTDDFDLPEDHLEWKATCHHSYHLMENAVRFVELCKTQYLYMMYVWGHSYEFGDKEEEWDKIEEFCRYIGGRGDIWYATNIEIVDYMNAAKNLKFSAAGDMVYNPAAITVCISVDGVMQDIEPGETKELREEKRKLCMI